MFKNLPNMSPYRAPDEDPNLAKKAEGLIRAFQSLMKDLKGFIKKDLRPYERPHSGLNKASYVYPWPIKASRRCH